MKTDFGLAKRQRNEEQNNGPRHTNTHTHTKKNGDDGYLGPVKIKLEKVKAYRQFLSVVSLD